MDDMHGKATDVRACRDVSVYWMPHEMRVVLKFGREIKRGGGNRATCVRVRLSVEGVDGKTAEGWGETPLAASWTWPSDLSPEERVDAMKAFCVELAGAWSGFELRGHPIEIGHSFAEEVLPGLLERFNSGRSGAEPMPWLSALVCCSAFDVALHDAYGVLHGVPVYDTYSAEYMNADLARFLTPAEGSGVSFDGRYPAEFLVRPRPDRIPAWHLVGGKDPVDESELTGTEPDDDYPVLLSDWIERDGLKCLKVKLRGNDAAWDYERLVKVGRMAVERAVTWLTADFNCTVKEPPYVNDILDRLMREHPRLHGMMLYVEQPFPYDLERNQIDVHSVSARKPLFMDESAHDWRLVKLGRELGWSGVALKTCKTQSGAILSLCWAKAHDMPLMVQDLTNRMLGQIPHVLLGAYAGTIMGLESNGMQFCPDASKPEAEVHPGLYRRTDGMLDLSTVGGPGMGYRLDQIRRELPAPVAG